MVPEHRHQVVNILYVAVEFATIFTIYLVTKSWGPLSLLVGIICVIHIISDLIFMSITKSSNQMFIFVVSILLALFMGFIGNIIPVQINNFILREIAEYLRLTSLFLFSGLGILFIVVIGYFMFFKKGDQNESKDW